MKKVLKWVSIVVGASVLIFIGAAIGSSGAEVTLNENKVDAVALDKEIGKLKIEKTILTDDIEAMQGEKKETTALIEKKDEIAKELADTKSKLEDTARTLDAELADSKKKIDDELASMKEKLSNAKSDLKDTKSELASATGKLKKAKGEPKSLQAGQYTVGQDIPAGRYKATPNGEGSNFIVNEGIKVNTILGSFGESSYTFFAEDGDVIQTEASVTLTPIEGE